MSAGGTTSPIHASTAAGDLMLLMHSSKLSVFPHTPADPSGWTKIGQAASGTTVGAASTGSVQNHVWYRIFVAGDALTGPNVNALNFNCVGACVMSFSKAAGDTWDLPVAVFIGAENTTDPYSDTYPSNPGVVTGDYIVQQSGFQDDAATPLTTHTVATQAGVTFTNTHDLAGGSVDNETTLGGDGGWCMNRATVSGTGSAAPVQTGDATTGLWREHTFVRLRATAPGGPSPDPVTGLLRRTMAVKRSVQM